MSFLEFTQDYSPISLFRTFYHQFKTRYTEWSRHKSGGVFDAQSNQKLEIYLPEVVEIEKAFGIIQNEGMSGVSQQLIDLQKISLE